MDIGLIETAKGSNIQPLSIHGMLWLQTHFNDAHWDAIAKNQVLIPHSEALDLSSDAKEGGLIIKVVPIVSSKSERF